MPMHFEKAASRRELFRAHLARTGQFCPDYSATVRFPSVNSCQNWPCDEMKRGSYNLLKP